MPIDIPLLNKTDPSAETDPPIPGNALNVTRVTGLAALISAVLAATPIFSAEPTDPTALKVAMPAIQGLIVVAALFTAAIVVAADIRGRATAANSVETPSSAKPSLVTPSDVTVQQYAADLRAALGEMHDKESRSLELSAFALTIADCVPPSGYVVRNNMYVLEIQRLSDDAANGVAGIGARFEEVYRRILQAATDLERRVGPIATKDE